jgi:hypothetical protein
VWDSVKPAGIQCKTPGSGITPEFQASRDVGSQRLLAFHLVTFPAVITISLVQDLNAKSIVIDCMIFDYSELACNETEPNPASGQSVLNIFLDENLWGLPALSVSRIRTNFIRIPALLFKSSEGLYIYCRKSFYCEQFLPPNGLKSSIYKHIRFHNIYHKQTVHIVLQYIKYVEFLT